MRATILVMLEETTEQQAILVKQAIDKVLEKVPKAETELTIRGK